MIAALVLTLAQVAGPASPSEIFSAAQKAWHARVVPPYISFQIDCALTFLDASCPRNANVHFVVRTKDGSSFAELVSTATGASHTLLTGGHITGPLATPLGFYRAVGDADFAAPPNLAPDPLPVIATVTSAAHIYDVTLAGEETVDGRPTYHLVLRPVTAPDRYPLRDLWVEESSAQIVQLTYDRPFDAAHTRAIVWYRFAPVGPQQIWTIVHIEARATTRPDRVSDDLSDITFPASAPSWYFDSGEP
jgi:hypothetical protein